MRTADVSLFQLDMFSNLSIVERSGSNNIRFIHAEGNDRNDKKRKNHRYVRRAVNMFVADEISGGRRHEKFKIGSEWRHNITAANSK